MFWTWGESTGDRWFPSQRTRWLCHYCFASSPNMNIFLCVTFYGVTSMLQPSSFGLPSVTSEIFDFIAVPTDITGVIWSSPTWINGMFTRSSCCLLPIKKNSVLLSFIISMLEIIQLFNSTTKFSLAVTELVWFMEGMGLNDKWTWWSPEETWVSGRCLSMICNRSAT